MISVRGPSGPNSGHNAVYFSAALVSKCLLYPLEMLTTKLTTHGIQEKLPTLPCKAWGNINYRLNSVNSCAVATMLPCQHGYTAGRPFRN